MPSGVYKRTKETRLKLSLSHIGIRYPNRKKNKPMTLEQRNERSRRMSGQNNPFFGKHFSDEHKKKLSIARKGIKYNDSILKKMSISKTGDKHPNWKGGISDKNRRLRGIVKYKNWRDKVFKRDNYTCTRCNFVGYVVAHHIKSFANFPKLRFDLNNGITLCEKCHSMTHNYKGRNKNVKKHTRGQDFRNSISGR